MLIVVVKPAIIFISLRRCCMKKFAIEEWENGISLKSCPVSNLCCISFSAAAENHLRWPKVIGPREDIKRDNRPIDNLVTRGTVICHMREAPINHLRRPSLDPDRCFRRPADHEFWPNDRGLKSNRGINPPARPMEPTWCP